jgi:hypothetical protein
LLVAAALSGCAEDSKPREKGEQPPRDEQPARIAPVRCDDAVASCRSATGRVLYVESVDADGDGDLHVVLASAEGISAPGITAVDVKPALRPRRDPRVGDLVAAAGPVYRGRFGQRQIEATAVRFRRR